MSYLRIIAAAVAMVSAVASAPAAMAVGIQDQPLHLVRAGGGGHGFHGGMGVRILRGGGFHEAFPGGYPMHDGRRDHYTHGYYYYPYAYSCPYPYDYPYCTF